MTSRVARVGGRRSFEQLRAAGGRGRHGVVRATHVPGGAEVRVATAVARRAVGSAVARNRVRRRLRAAAVEAALDPGTYLLSAGAEAADAPWPTLVDDVRLASSAAARSAR